MFDYFSLGGFFAWLCATLFIWAILALIYTYDEISRCAFLISTALIILVTGAIAISNGVNDEARRGDIRAEETNWVANGCPVYKSQCGEKHPYPCELKAVVVGRNRVGDIFVEAYPICKK